MRLSTVFIFNTLAALGYAAGLLIIPETIMTWHGIGIHGSTILMARYFGVALLGIGLVAWLARDTVESKARDAITIGFSISCVAGFVLSVQATLAGQMNSLGWLPAAAYLLLVLGYGFARFSR